MLIATYFHHIEHEYYTQLGLELLQFKGQREERAHQLVLSLSMKLNGQRPIDMSALSAKLRPKTKQKLMLNSCPCPPL